MSIQKLSQIQIPEELERLVKFLSDIASVVKIEEVKIGNDRRIDIKAKIPKKKTFKIELKNVQGKTLCSFYYRDYRLVITDDESSRLVAPTIYVNEICCFFKDVELISLGYISKYDDKGLIITVKPKELEINYFVKEKTIIISNFTS